MGDDTVNIGFFSDSYEPQKNGVVTAVKTQKIYLEKFGHKVYLVIPNIPNSPNGNTYKLPSITFIFQKEHRVAIPYSLKIDILLNKKNLHIIHTHSPFSLGIFGWQQARKRKIPLVHTYHTLFDEYAYYIWDHFPSFIKKRLIKEDDAKKIALWYSLYYSNLCDLIIAPSTKVKRILENNNIKVPVEVLPNGIDFKEFKPIDKKYARIKRGYPLDGILLLFVGRLGKEKNISYLLNVIRWLKNHSNYPFYLIIIGDNPNKNIKESLMKEAEKLNILDNVIFTGYLDYPSVIESYYASDIFVFSSLTETQGLVVLEALFSGLPVVALKDLAIEDFVINGINGFLIANDEKGIENFGKKIILLVENRDLYNKISYYAKKHASSFNLDNMIKMQIELYENLIKERKRYA